MKIIGWHQYKDAVSSREAKKQPYATNEYTIAPPALKIVNATVD